MKMFSRLKDFDRHFILFFYHDLFYVFNTSQMEPFLIAKNKKESKGLRSTELGDVVLQKYDFSEFVCKK